MSNHYDVHFKCLIILCVNYTSIMPKKEKITIVLPMSPRKNACEALSVGPDNRVIPN